MTGYDEAVPAGRDLTANDVIDVMQAWRTGRVNVAVATDELNRIARPSGGVGQPDTTVPRSWSLPAPPPDDVTVVHVPAANADLTDARFHRDDDGNWWNDAGAEIWGWSKLLGLGMVVEGEPPAPARCGNCGVLLDQDHYGDDDGIGLCWSCRELEPAPEPQAAEPPELRDWVPGVGRHDPMSQPPDEWLDEPQAAEPPRFERGFYRLARDLDVGPDTVTAGSLIFLASVEGKGTHGAVHGVSALARVEIAALAAAGAVRVEEEQA